MPSVGVMIGEEKLIMDMNWGQEGKHLTVTLSDGFRAWFGQDSSAGGSSLGQGAILFDIRKKYAVECLKYDARGEEETKRRQLSEKGTTEPYDRTLSWNWTHTNGIKVRGSLNLRELSTKDALAMRRLCFEEYLDRHKALHHEKSEHLAKKARLGVAMQSAENVENMLRAKRHQVYEELTSELIEVLNTRKRSVCALQGEEEERDEGEDEDSDQEASAGSAYHSEADPDEIMEESIVTTTRERAPRPVQPVKQKPNEKTEPVLTTIMELSKESSKTTKITSKKRRAPSNNVSSKMSVTQPGLGQSTALAPPLTVASGPVALAGPVVGHNSRHIDNGVTETPAVVSLPVGERNVEDLLNDFD